MLSALQVTVVSVLGRATKALVPAQVTTRAPAAIGLLTAVSRRTVADVAAPEKSSTAIDVLFRVAEQMALFAAKRSAEAVSSMFPSAAISVVTPRENTYFAGVALLTAGSAGRPEVQVSAEAATTRTAAGAVTHHHHSNNDTVGIV